MKLHTVYEAMMRKSAGLIYYEDQDEAVPMEPNYKYRLIPNAPPSQAHIRTMLQYLHSGDIFVPKGWTLKGSPRRS